MTEVDRLKIFKIRYYLFNIPISFQNDEPCSNLISM